MWLRDNVVKGHRYYRIVHSVRKGKKVMPKTILQLGKLDDRTADLIREWLRGFPMKTDEYVTTPLKAIKTIRQWRHGGEFIAKSIWDDFKLTELIDGIVKCKENAKIKPGRLIMIMAVNRCIDPKSKLGIVEGYYPGTTLQFLCGISPDDLYTDLLYWVMDKLDENADEIKGKLWRKIKQKFKLSSDVVLYDMTSTYFESADVNEKKKENCMLRQHGYSREHRKDKKQVNWGLVLTQEGFPITYEVYSGNTPDKNTPATIYKKLREDFGIKKCIFTGDRGMMTANNVKIIEEKYLYILAESVWDVKDIILPEIENIPDEVWKSKYPLDEKVKKIYGIEEIDENLFCIEMTKKIDRKDVRFVICHNRGKVKDDKEFREKQMAKGMRIIEKVQNSVRTGRLKDHDKVLKRIVKNLSKKNLENYFDWKIPPTPVSDFEYWIRKDKIEEWEKLDGKWVVRTNIKKPNTSEEITKSAAEIVSAYKDLKIVERAFRTIKSFIKVRPVGHHLDVRIRAHIFICVLAYLIEKTIEYRLKSSRIEMTAQKLFYEFDGIELTENVLGDKVKILVKRVTEPNKTQRNLLSILRARGITKLNEEIYL